MQKHINYKNIIFLLKLSGSSKKIVNEIINTLPIQAECWKLEHEKSSINTEINLFVNSFFENKIQYFYYEKENLFFQYDGLNYSFIHEDDLLYKILSKISEKKKLIRKKTND